MQRYPERASASGDQSGLKTHGDLNAMLYYHRLGTSQCMYLTSSQCTTTEREIAEDILVVKNDENPEWMWSAEVTEDGRYLALYIIKDTSRVSD
jgi:prolyl oligopeptidase